MDKIILGIIIGFCGACLVFALYLLLMIIAENARMMKLRQSTFPKKTLVESMTEARQASTARNPPDLDLWGKK